MKTKIVIIDHQDSFTYNLVQLFEQAGATITVKSYNEIGVTDFSQYEGIVFSPGPGLPTDYPDSIQLIDEWKAKIPILGICMGLQLIVVKFGGKLLNLSHVMHGERIEIYKTTTSPLFNEIDFPFCVGLYHSWAMDKRIPLPSLQITSTLLDGTVMSLQHEKYTIQAVQFHPESFMTEKGSKLVMNWLKMIK